MRNIDVDYLLNQRRMTPKEFAENTGLPLPTVNVILKDIRRMRNKGWELASFTCERK
jgi:hypothetical protein